MIIVAFYLTIILSFSVFAAGEYNDDKSKEEFEYYQKLNLAKAYERGTVLKKDEKKAFLYYLDAVRNSKHSEPDALKYLEKKGISPRRRCLRPLRIHSLPHARTILERLKTASSISTGTLMSTT